MGKPRVCDFYTTTIKNVNSTLVEVPASMGIENIMSIEV